MKIYIFFFIICITIITIVVFFNKFWFETKENQQKVSELNESYGLWVKREPSSVISQMGFIQNGGGPRWWEQVLVFTGLPTDLEAPLEVTDELSRVYLCTTAQVWFLIFEVQVSLIQTHM